MQAADVYFLIGMVYTEIVNHSMALEAFNNTLKINPEFSQVSLSSAHIVFFQVAAKLKGV